MKQTTKTVLLALACAALAACGAKGGEKEAGDGAPKSAVVFYSQNGATRALAGLFAEATGAAVVELKLVEPYPSTYDSTIAAVREERETGRWPALAEAVVPFCTYGSGGRKAGADELRSLEPNADVTIAMGISNRRITAENGLDVARNEVAAFLADLAEGKTEETLCGGFSEQRPLTAEDSAVFAKAAEPYAYLNLRPLSVSTQVVAGMNYLFVCEMKAFGGPAKEARVKIFRPLPGRGEPELIVVE